MDQLVDITGDGTRVMRVGSMTNADWEVFDAAVKRAFAFSAMSGYRLSTKEQKP
jgi:hypothetical protein